MKKVRGVTHYPPVPLAVKRLAKLRADQLRKKGEPNNTSDAQKLYELQNGLCWLCWRPIDLSATHGIERGSIDHYIPRSKGGRNEWSNKLLAHAGCNSRRGSKRPTMSRALALSVLQYTDELA